MTTFEKEESNTAASKPEETKETTKTEDKKESKALVVAMPPSRIKADPKRWDEALVLSEMLSYCRPNNSKTERGFIGKYIVPAGIRFDKSGNAHKIIGDAPVIWSSHTDTVHNKNGMQKIVYWVEEKENNDTFFFSEGANASCLGADDTAGVWLMLEMIKANIPGHYIFHRGEECGGIGSRWIAKNCAEMLKTYQFAIAFDRKDMKSIITHQGSKKTASDEFAKLLAEQIGMGHEPDSTGMWTDTAAYVDDVAECTNISVGYYGAHGKGEKLNVDYVLKLRDAMCKIDVNKFVATRKPGDNAYKTYKYEGGRYNGGSYHGSYADSYDNYDSYDYGSSWRKEEDRPAGGKTGMELNKAYGSYTSWERWYQYEAGTGYWKPKKGVVPPNPEKWRKKHDKSTNSGGWMKRQQEMFSTIRELREMKILIQDNPTIIADLLDGQGYGPLELKEYIGKCGGLIQDEVICS